jgi:hypothetical protein
MKSPIWELRFMDGRGASFYTTSDVTRDIGQSETRIVLVAAQVSQARAIKDARACFEHGRTKQLVAHMSAIAYALRHEAVAR